jgi:hypothetical protein
MTGGALALSLVDRVAAAYRSDLWAAARTVEVSLDAGGPLFGWKRGRAGRWRDLHVVAAVHRQRIELIDFHRGRSAFLDGHSVWLQNPSTTRETRPDARSRFPYGMRLAHWDVLDMTYFLGYALWNYLTFPALLGRSDITWSQTGLTELTAHFPAELATHSPRQRFRVDPATCLVAEHQYTAEVFGKSWAHACHLSQQYQESGGVPYASRRRVHPRRPGGDGPLRRPVLIWADIHSFRLLPEPTKLPAKGQTETKTT